MAKDTWKLYGSVANETKGIVMISQFPKVFQVKQSMVIMRSIPISEHFPRKL